MKTLYFIATVLFSGCIAGIVYGLVNLAIVEPFLDAAINIENQNKFSSGQEHDTPQFWAEYYSYRAWQKGGQLLAGAIYGTSVGALFGVIFAYSKNSLPSNHLVKKALILSGVMWATMYVIPFAKYPANPPTVGDPETIILRQTLYVLFVAISGFGALGFYKLYKKTGKKALGIIGYAAFISTIFVIMPQNPDAIGLSEDLLYGFRATSFASISVFWFALAVILGMFWQKIQPDKTIQSKLN